MRYYPLEKDAQFYIENINKWKTHQTCKELDEKLKRNKENICGTNKCMHFAAPEKSKTKKQKKKKETKDKGKAGKGVNRGPDFGKNRQYEYECEQKIIQSWGDIEGSKLQRVSDKDLHFDNWQKSRCKIRTKLPIYYEGARIIEVTKNPPAGFLYSRGVMSLEEVRLAMKREKELAKQALIAAKLAKELEKANRAKKPKTKT